MPHNLGTCTLANINYWKNTYQVDACLFTTENQECQGESFINFLSLYYCTFAKLPYSTAISISFAFILLALLFYLISSTTATWLSTSLSTIAKYLKMSESLAGITLMALGNGSPEFITGLVAAGSSSGPILSIGSIFGSAIIISALIPSLIVFFSVSGEIHMNKRKYIRDYIMLLLTLGVFASFYMTGKIYWWMPLILFGIYAVYIFITLLMEKYDNSKHTDSLLASYIANDDNLIKKSICANDQPLQKHTNKCLSIVTFILHVPTIFIRRLTIPSYERENWSRYQTAIFPLGALTYICCIFWIFPMNVMGISGFSYAYILYPIALLLSVLIFKLTGKEAPNIIGLFTVCTFIMSLLWIWLFVRFVVDLINAVGLIGELDVTYLGTLFIALGTATVDITNDVKISRLGFGEMALTATVSSPIFNICLGLGSCLLVTILKEEYIYFSIKPWGVENGYSCVIASTSILIVGGLVLMNFIAIICTKFKSRKVNGILQLIGYLSAVGCLSLIAFTIVRNQISIE